MKAKTSNFLSLAISLIVLLPASFLPFAAYGSGFAIFTQGASSLGQAAATVAHNEEPSAIFFNPALISKIPGSQIEIGTTLIYPSRRFFSAADGALTEGESRTYFPSTAYFTREMTDRLHFGLGIFSPFGLGTRWPDDWEGRYLATKSEITTVTANPVIAWQVLPSLSVAAGVNLLWLDTTLERKIPTALIAGAMLPDSGQRFSGDGTGVGYNVGLHADLHERVALGISYRSEISVDIDGKATFSDVPPELGPLFPETGARSKITLPQQLFAALAYRVTDRLILETGLRWEGWSSMRELAISLDEPILEDVSVLREPKRWRDTYAVNVGGKYRLTERTSILAGYLYGQNAIPDSTFEPSVPDADSHLFSLGAEVAIVRVKLAFSYAYQLLESRVKDNTVGADIGSPANGRYKSNLQMAAVSLTYPF